MKFISLLCPVCLQKYNLEEHIPRSLQCGHTICTKCLEIILKESEPRCPLDKKYFSEEYQKIEAFPNNFTVQGLIEENPQWEVCKTHGERIKLVCFTDRCKVCAYCALNGIHREHEVKHISELRPQIDDKKSKIEEILKNIDQHYNSLVQLFDDKREETLKILDEKVKEFMFMLRMRKGELACDINRYFDEEKRRLVNFVGKESELRTCLESKIHLYKNYSKIEDPFTLLEEDISYLTLAHDQEVLKKNHGDIDSKLQERMDGFNKTLNSYLDLLNNFKIPNRDFIERLDVKYSANEGSDPLNNINISSSFILEGSMKLQRASSFFNVSFENEKKRRILLDSKEFKDFTELRIEIKDKIIHDHDLVMLEEIANKMNNLDSVRISVAQSIEESSLIEVFSAVLYNPRSIKRLCLIFPSIEITSLALELLSTRVLPFAENLERLYLDFSKSGIDDQGLLSLSTHALPLLGKLEALNIYLSNTLVQDKYLEELLFRIPSVQTLVIDLKETKISSQAIENFLQNKLPNLTNLRKFNLILADTKVSGDLKEQVQQIQKDFDLKQEGKISEESS